MMNTNDDNDSNNGYNAMDGLPEDALPVSEAVTESAKEYIAMYRTMGLDDSEMRILRDFPGGPEDVAINRSGFIKAARATKGGGYETIKVLNENGAKLTLDEELEIIGQGSVAEQLSRSFKEFMSGVKTHPSESANVIFNHLTFGQLEDLWRGATKLNGEDRPEDVLGSCEHCDYIHDQFKRLALAYGRDKPVNAVIAEKDAHAMAVILNAFGRGRKDRESIASMEKALAEHMATL